MHDWGLSRTNRNYVVGLVFFLLLLFGPVQPYGLVVRFAYLAVIPAMLWLALYFGGRHLDIDAIMNDHITRAITAGLAGALVVAAFVAFTADYHFDCAQVVPDGSGDCVGEQVMKSGADYVRGFMATMLAVVAFWIAIAPSRD